MTTASTACSIASSCAATVHIESRPGTWPGVRTSHAKWSNIQDEATLQTEAMIPSTRQAFPYEEKS